MKLNFGGSAEEYEIAFPMAGRETLLTLNQKVDTIMTTQQEMTADMKAQVETMKRVGEESKASLAAVKDFEAKLQAAGTKLTPELEQAWAELKGQIKTVDDLIPDSTTPPATPPVTPPTTPSGTPPVVEVPKVQ